MAQASATALPGGILRTCSKKRFNTWCLEKIRCAFRCPSCVRSMYSRFS